MFYAWRRFMRDVRLLIFLAFIAGIIGLWVYLHREQYARDLGLTKADVTKVSVDRVIDGDTLSVKMKDGKIETVRLIGIDTPETKRPGVAVECGGLEASNNMKRMLKSGDTVKLTTDKSQDKYDKYDRLLAYVKLEGTKKSVNQRQLAAGYADLYVFDNKEFAQYDNFRRAANIAKRASKGVHALCDSDFHSEQ